MTARRRMVGATDAVALLGLSSYRSPADVVAAHLGMLKERPIDARLSERGADWEAPLLAFAGARLAPLTVEPTPNHWVPAPEGLAGPVPFGVSPDAYVRNPVLGAAIVGVVDAKTAAWASAPEWANGGAPAAYVAQVQFQLAAVCGVGEGMGWLAAAVADPCGLPRLELVEVPPDGEWQREALEELAARWDAWVVRRLPPPPSDTAGGRAIDGEIARRTGRSRLWQVSGDDALLLRRAAEAVTAERRATAEREDAEALLRRRMAETSTRWVDGGAKVSLGKSGRLTWSV